jgi:hypothetical protein
MRKTTPDLKCGASGATTRPALLLDSILASSAIENVQTFVEKYVGLEKMPCDVGGDTSNFTAAC